MAEPEIYITFMRHGRSRADDEEVHEGRSHFPPPAFRSPYAHYNGGHESDWDFYSRRASALQNVIQHGPGLYLVVAHGGILNSALRTIFQTPIHVNGQGVWFRFGGASFGRAVYRLDKHQWGLLELSG